MGMLANLAPTSTRTAGSLGDGLLGMTVASVVFVARVVSVLVRFRRTDQPSQPGRTNPDS
ncbi:DUF6332 family protein [Streptomyces olivaceoviridis]